MTGGWTSSGIVEASPPDESEMGTSLMEDWLETFELYSYQNRLYGFATFHLILGQMPFIRTLKLKKTSRSYTDGRVHVAYIAPSASGKGEGANFVQTIAKRVGLTYQEADDLTDSALLGSNSPDRNNPGEFHTNPGWLSPELGKNIIAATEASSLLTEKPKPAAEKVMNHLQKTMNAMGTSDATIVKKTGIGEEITVKPTCSLFLTTYAPVYLTDIVVSRGFLQRMYFIVKTLTLREREEMAVIREERIKNPPDTREAEESIARRIIYINKHYENKEVITLSKEAAKIFSDQRKVYFDRIRGTSPFIQEKLGEFVTRFEDVQYKVAMHYACMGLRDEIDAEDARHAKNEADMVFEDLVSFLERFIKVPKEYQENFDKVRKQVLIAFAELEKSGHGHGWVSRGKAVAYVSKTSRTSPQTANENLKFMTSAGILEAGDHTDLGEIVRVKQEEESDH